MSDTETTTKRDITMNDLKTLGLPMVTDATSSILFINALADKGWLFHFDETAMDSLSDKGLTMAALRAIEVEKMNTFDFIEPHQVCINALASVEKPDDTMSNIVMNAVATQMKAETITPKIQAAVEELIDKVIKDSIRNFSDNGRLIEAAVKDALAISSLDLPSYGATVCTILETQIESKVAALVQGQLTADMAELLTLAPKEIKLSKIVERMLKNHYEYDEKYSEQLVTCIVDNSRIHGMTFIYLDDDDAYTEDDKYNCQVQFHINKDGKIGGGKSKDRFSPHETSLDRSKQFGRGHGIENIIRGYWACGTTIIIDDEEPKTSREYD